MSNVQWKDPVRAPGRTGKPHMRRRRGGPRAAERLPVERSHGAGLKPSMVPRTGADWAAVSWN